MRSENRIFVIVGLALVSCLLTVGAEFNAHMLSVVVDNESVKHAPVWLTCAFTMLAVVLPFLCFSRLSPVYALLAICLYIVVIAFFAFAVAYLLQLWIVPTGAIIAVLLAYPLWSCARLNTAQLALDQALQNLQDELTRLGMEPEAETEASHHTKEDPQQARIRRLALTAKHLRDMHRARSDTLVFISHDIRAPLGAAMLLLEKFEHNKHTERLQHLLQRAYNVAEGFLQASRAEMSDVNKFNLLDLVSITQQAADDIFERLNAKGIVLKIEASEASVWIRGDFGLLFRAISNVLLNAVNYSPENAVIRVFIDKDEKMSRLRVVDQGPGIPDDRIDRLFKRFSRVDGEYQDQEGSGLGLYFVGVTVRKHRGSVSVENVQPHGAMFVIAIPLERRNRNIQVEHERRVKANPAFEDTL